MEVEIIKRLTYDGNYQRAIIILSNLVENQEKEITKLRDELNDLKLKISY